MRLNVEEIVDGMEGIAYLTDTEGTIFTIGRRHWNRFAAENGASEMVDGNGVIGHNLFDFIAGDDVREKYRAFLGAIVGRRAGRARLFSRCDSPVIERQLMITVTPIYTGASIEGALWQSSTMSETMRPRLDLFDFAQLRRHAGNGGANWPILAMCSYCQHVRYPIGSSDDDGEWIAADDYYHRGGDSRVRISHGLCPTCFEDAEKSLHA